MGPQRTELESGAVVVSERMAGMQSVSFGLYFPTGSRFETPHNNGISHFIEHLVFKGTERRTARDINREIDWLGGTSNAYTSKEMICFHARVLADQLPRLMELFADLASHGIPQGLEAEVERERKVIISEIAAIADSPEELVGDLCDQVYFGDHSLALPVAGSARAVACLNVPEIRSHFRRHIVSRDLVIVAVGKVDHLELVDLARRNLEEIPRGGRREALTPPTPQSGTRVLERDLEQLHLCLSARGVPRGDHRRRTADLLSVIVGDGYSSRLFREVRDQRGLAYSIYSSPSGYLDSGSFNIYAGIAPSKLGATLDVVGSVLSDVRRGGIVSEELLAAKHHLRVSMILEYEMSAARMGYLAEQVVLGKGSLDFERELEGIEQVERAELNALAGELFESPLAVAAVGPIAAGELGVNGWEIPA